MRTRAGVTAGVTAGVAVLSVFASALGHAVVAGHPVPGSALPQLGLLAALCFLLASQRLVRPILIVALSLIQVAVHVILARASAASPPPAPVMDHAAHHAHHGHDLPAIASGAGAQDAGADLPMLAMHLVAMLGTLALLHAAAVWWERLVVALARVLPRLPLVPVGFVRPVGAAYAVVATPCPQRWLPATVRRRGPPAS